MRNADYRRLVEDSPLPTLLVEDRGAGWRAGWANHAAVDLLGRSVPADGDGIPVADLVHPDDRDEVLAALRRGAPGDRTALEWRFVRPDGDVVTVEVLLGGTGGALSLSCWDVTQHVARTRDLTYRATHDRLTGLPNRGLLEDRWTIARSRATRSGAAPVVAFCDVDDLKRLNDEHGHLAGDHALVEIALRLTGASRSADTVARFGGDEFVVLVESSADVEPGALTRRLRDALTDVPVALPDGTTVLVSCSVGLVVDDLSSSPAEVLNRADRYMYEEKRRDRAGRG